MERNEFVDLNTTELFDDSNDSFDKNREGNDCDSDNSNSKTIYSLDNECNSKVDEAIESDAGNISTDLTTAAKPQIQTDEVDLKRTSPMTSTITSGLSIVQKSAKPPDVVSLKKANITENPAMQFNLKPTTVISQPTEMQEIVTNIDSNLTPITATSTIVSRSNEPSIVSIRQQQSLIRPKVATLVAKQQNSISKYAAKPHTTLSGTIFDPTTLNTGPKLVKIAPSTTSFSTSNTLSDIKSPVIIVQAPSQKLGQRFTSLKILQQSPGIVRPKILNLNEMAKLRNCGGSLQQLKPLILNATASNTVSASPSSLIVLKQQSASGVSTTTSPSNTLQLKPQQLYQPIMSANPSKPATFSIVTTTAGVTPKPTSIAIGTKLIPSRILTTVKATTADTPLITTISQQPLPVGLTKIPKDTIIKQIQTKDAQGASIDFLKMLKAKHLEKTIEPTVTIGQKQMCNKPALEFQSLTNFLSADKQKVPSSINTSKYNDHQSPINFQMSNGMLIEKSEGNKLDKNNESITISNGTISNPNGSIKVMKSTADVDILDVQTIVPATTQDDVRYTMKNIETLKRSPRLTGRSKSLTTSKGQSKKVRRRYASFENCMQMASTIGKLREHLTDGKGNATACAMIEDISEEPDDVIEIQSEQTKTVRRSLECDEKIDDSDKSKSVSPDVGAQGANIRPIPNVVKNAVPPVKLTSHIDKKDDPLNYMRWRNGIGYLKFSNLQFRKNEFGLLETLETKEFSKNQNIINQPAVVQRNEQTEHIDCVEKKAEESYQTVLLSAMNKKKLESKRTKKPGGMSLLRNVFVWELYLRLTNAQAAPDSFFLNPFPSSLNLFEVGMKLEAVDPEHCSLFCVCTVVEKLGYRIRLTFDGYSDKHSFWRNADSMDIFPPGWCAKTGRTLQPPLKYGSEQFDWHRYILKTNGKFAPRSNFTHLNSMTSRNPFKVGMKLEAENPKFGRGKLCVATVADIIDNRILLRFDAFDESFDCWTDITSPFIHPFNWHRLNKSRLYFPKESEKSFSWAHYLNLSHSQPVPKEFFCPRSHIAFRQGMKLEIVDKKVPSLIRPCTVTQTADYYIQVLFDGWPSTYAYWIEDDHPDIHPINWCLKTEHPLEPPLNFGPEEFKSTCGVLGCREVGNAKHYGLGFHYTIFECPYESRNWLSIDTKPDRLCDIKSQKAKKRKMKSIMSTATTESYKQIKMEPPPPPPTEENVSLNQLSNDWAPTELLEPFEVKKEEIEIGETELHATSLDTLSQEQSIKQENTSTSLPKHIKVTETILHDYGPGLMHIHKLWVENSKPMNIRRIDANPLCWTVDEVVDYVARLPNCSRLGNLFRDHEVDGDAFLKLCQNDLVDILKIRLGPAVKIYNQIVVLRSEVCELYIDRE